MKRAEDKMRTGYKRSGLPRLERGKLYAEVPKGTAVALLEPAIAKSFPTSRGVNEALHSLLELTERTARITAVPADARAAEGQLLAVTSTTVVDRSILHSVRMATGKVVGGKVVIDAPLEEGASVTVLARDDEKGFPCPLKKRRNCSIDCRSRPR